MDEISFTPGTGIPPGDRDTQLREENEILKMRIIAEFGGVPGELSDVPPDVANRFLKNVIAFEKQCAENPPKMVTVESLLENTVFPKESTLKDAEFKKEWKRLVKLLKNKSLWVNFIRKRDDRFQYRFITEELFQHETDASTMMPGMELNFIYEEFHPDHEQEIRDRTDEFMEGWFQRDVEKLQYGLAAHFIQPDGEVLKQGELLTKIQNVFDCYDFFLNGKYHIIEIKFELYDDEEGIQSLGHSEGVLKYEALLESGERKIIHGPFKIYMAREFDWWDIVYFVMPGFEKGLLK